MRVSSRRSHKLARRTRPYATLAGRPHAASAKRRHVHGRTQPAQYRSRSSPLVIVVGYAAFRPDAEPQEPGEARRAPGRHCRSGVVASARRVAAVSRRLRHPAAPDDACFPPPATAASAAPPRFARWCASTGSRRRPDPADLRRRGRRRAGADRVACRASSRIPRTPAGARDRGHRPRRRARRSCCSASATHKDATGSDSLSADGLLARMTRTAKDAAPELVVITDNCFCEYTDHGHCGVLDRGRACAQRPHAGEPGPAGRGRGRSRRRHGRASAMMDGQIAAIRAGAGRGRASSTCRSWPIRASSRPPSTARSAPPRAATCRATARHTRWTR